MFNANLVNLNQAATIVPQSTPAVADGAQRIELTLKKISEQTEGTLQALPISSACTSGCFSSVSSISVKSGDVNAIDEAQVEQVIRLHDKALAVMGSDGLVSAAIAKAMELDAK